MNNDVIAISLRKVDGIGLLSLTSELFFSREAREQSSAEDREYLETQFRQDITLIIDSFIESFPHHQVSQVEYRTDQKSRFSTPAVDLVSVPAGDSFEFLCGSWFVCSERPLDLTFAEHNKLLGYDARIPSGNWGGKFTRWASKVLESTGATCFGIMDLDDSYLTVCFRGADLCVIESHLEPIMNKHGLRISKLNSKEELEKYLRQSRKAMLGHAVIMLITTIVAFGVWRLWNPRWWIYFLLLWPGPYGLFGDLVNVLCCKRKLRLLPK